MGDTFLLLKSSALRQNNKIENERFEFLLTWLSNILNKRIGFITHILASGASFYFITSLTRKLNSGLNKLFFFYILNCVKWRFNFHLKTDCVSDSILLNRTHLGWTIKKFFYYIARTSKQFLFRNCFKIQLSIFNCVKDNLFYLSIYLLFFKCGTK